MRKTLYIATAVASLAMLWSCGTQKQVVTMPQEAPVQQMAEQVTPNPEVISIAEAISIFEHPEAIAEVTKKYGYTLKNGYEIYRLDKFSKMYYKNCKLAKILTGTAYEDYPKPLRKGVSSYVAFKDGAIIIGVFNQAAYDNLVAQVKAAGFVLDMPGNEDIYIKGGRTIGCYAGAKTVRVQ